jgi:hypothetical protein
MPIGVVASDPALTNRSLQSRQAPGSFEHLFRGIADGGGFGPGDIGVPTGPGTYTPPGVGGGADGGGGGDESETRTPPFDAHSPQNPNGTSDGGEPTPRNSAERIPSGPRRRVNDGEYGQLVRAADLEEGGGDDLSKALGSVELLLQAYGAR